MLKDLSEGRRNLTLPVMEKYAEAMNLSTRERGYFELLVRFAHSKSNAEKNDCFAGMVRLRGQSGIHFLGQDHYEYFSEWYNSAIRELVTLPNFVENPKLIAKQLEPNITPKKVIESIELLLRTGILKRNEAGELEQSDGIISSEYEMASAALRNFHSQMVTLAERSIESIPREQREVSSLTVGISKQMQQRIKERIRIFKEELLGMIVDDQSDSETICQINFQLFPLINTGEEPAEGDK